MLVLHHFKSEIQARTVLLLCAFASVVSYLRKEGSVSISRSLSPLMGNSLDLPGLVDLPACQTHSVSSEFDCRQSFTLQASFHRVAYRPPSFREDLRSTFLLDLFASCRNAHLQVSLSPFPNMSANGVDALSHTWDFPGVLFVCPAADWSFELLMLF